MAKTKGKEKQADPIAQPELEEINEGASNDANPVESTHEVESTLISGAEITEKNGDDRDTDDVALQSELNNINVSNEVLEKGEQGSGKQDVKNSANKKAKTNRKKATTSAGSKKGGPNTSVEANSSAAIEVSPGDATALKDAIESEILTQTGKISSDVAEEDKDGEQIEKENQEGKEDAKDGSQPAKASTVAKEVLKEDTKDNKSKGNMQKKESSGLIFMCNKKTKGDCFKYSVLGLPESKKETVEKIYKGMRLFLYNTDLKLMYGIYKADSPGGYNIESEAFKSAFPSQVRFAVFKECTPLPEEKFKPVIKANYYGRSKFDCKLSSEQVKNLCNLFVKENSSSDSQQNGASKKKVVSNVDDRKKGRSNVGGRKRQRSRSRSVDRSSKRRLPALDQHVGRRRYTSGSAYQRATYSARPLVQPSYAQERLVSNDYYGRELPVEHYRREIPVERYREVPVDHHRQELVDPYRREVPLDHYRRELPHENPTLAVYRGPETIPEPYYPQPSSFRAVQYANAPYPAPTAHSAAAYYPSYSHPGYNY